MKRISLALIVLGLSASPLLVNASTQDSSYESGKQVGEAVNTAKVKTAQVWKTTKTNSKEAVVYVKDKSFQAQEATVAKYHQTVQATSRMADKTKVKTAQVWEATKANSKEAVAYVKGKYDEVASSTSQAADSFSQGIEDSSK